jgi:hypothetical protein
MSKNDLYTPDKPQTAPKENVKSSSGANVSKLYTASEYSDILIRLKTLGEDEYPV